MKYYVRYIETCEPKLAAFSNEQDARNFALNFFLKYQFVNTDDNHVESIFQGTIMYIDPAVKIQDFNKKAEKSK